jgi:hypothetical protein
MHASREARTPIARLFGYVSWILVIAEELFVGVVVAGSGVLLSWPAVARDDVLRFFGGIAVLIGGLLLIVDSVTRITRAALRSIGGPSQSHTESQSP